jgi:Ta0938
LKVREDGCVICGSTWGDYWREIEGQRMFFCCEVCANEYGNMVAEVKKRTGWRSVDEINMEGNFRGRSCEALNGSQSYKFFVIFEEGGAIRNFVERQTSG